MVIIFGVLWKIPIKTAFIRRVRYSKNLADVKEQMRMDPTFMQKKVGVYTLP